MQNVKSKLWIALLELAKIGAYDEKIKISSGEFGKVLKVSQQTSSQRIIKLEEYGWIERKVYRRSQIIQITNKGKKILKKLYNDLKMVIEIKDSEKLIEYPQKIRGTVYTGYGEGAYYISLKGYENQFIEKLNFKPFPGTLNLKLTSLTELRKRRILERDEFPKIEIKGFKDGSRTYGNVNGLKVLINGKIEGAILFIQRTHHSAPILEIISPFYLRDELDLKDDDEVELEIFYAT